MGPAARNELSRSETSALYWWSGLCSVLAGVLFLWGGATFLVWDYFGEGARSIFGEQASPALSFLLHVAILVLMPLSFFVALVGLYNRLAGWERTLGAIGLSFAACGSAWRIVSYFVDVYPLYSRFAERGWPPYLLDWTLYLLVGLTLISVCVVRTQTLGHWSRLPVAAGFFGWAFYVTDPFSQISWLVIHIISGVLFGLSWVLLGYVFWLDRRQQLASHAAR